MAFDHIPSELKALSQWVCWRLEQRGDGKPSKIPYRIDGRRASSTCPDDWTGFETAYKAYAWEILVRAFQNGLTSGRQPGRSADGTLEDLFVECGKHSDGVVSAALPDGFENAPKEAAIRLIGIVTDAFGEDLSRSVLNMFFGNAALACGALSGFRYVLNRGAFA